MLPDYDWEERTEKDWRWLTAFSMLIFFCVFHTVYDHSLCSSLLSIHLSFLSGILYFSLVSRLSEKHQEQLESVWKAFVSKLLFPVLRRESVECTSLGPNSIELDDGHQWSHLMMMKLSEIRIRMRGGRRKWTCIYLKITSLSGHLIPSVTWDWKESHV